MAVWDIDLSNRAGARGASYQAALACFVYCGMTALGGFFVSGLIDVSSPQGKVTAVLVAAQLLLTLIAGILLRQGRGAVWGVAVAAVMVLNLVGSLIQISIFSAILTGLLLLLLINGLRGTFALRSASRFVDDDIDAFT